MTFDVNILVIQRFSTGALITNFRDQFSCTYWRITLMRDQFSWNHRLHLLSYCMIISFMSLY